MEEYRGELLAPAGTMDCLKAAIAAGADAVYLGGQRFGARAFAGNFSREELLEGLSLAHLWNRKIYLTVNTLTKQDELSGLCDWIAPFYEAGLDGVIVQDMGVLEKLRKNFPGMELHASTQMTVTESRSALFLKFAGRLSDCPGEGIEPGRNSPVKRTDRSGNGSIYPWSLVLLLFRTVPVFKLSGRKKRKPGTLCAAMQTALYGAWTGSRRGQEGRKKSAKTSGVSAELKRSLRAAVFTGVDGCKNRFL